MAKRLEGKVAIVVGAGQTPGDTIGNGRATAILFAREGRASCCCGPRPRLGAGDDRDDRTGRGRRSGRHREADITRGADCARIAESCARRLRPHRRAAQQRRHRRGDGGPASESARRTGIASSTSTSRPCFYLQARAAAHAQATVRLDHQHLVGGRGLLARTPCSPYNTSKAAVNAFTHSVAMQNAHLRHPRQRDHAGLDPHAHGDRRHLRRDAASPSRNSSPQRDARVPMAANGRRVGRRLRRVVPRLGRGAVHHRRGAPVDGGQSARIG